MAKQTLVIESPMELSLNGEMMLISDKGPGEKTLRSIEDIRLVMTDNRMVRFTVPLLNKLSECQLAAKMPTNKQLWKQIVESKIRNLSLLLEKLGEGKALLTAYYNNVKMAAFFL